MLTWMPGFALLKSATAFLEASPSAPSPWVANTIETGPEVPPPEPQAARKSMLPPRSAAANRLVTTMSTSSAQAIPVGRRRYPADDPTHPTSPEVRIFSHQPRTAPGRAAQPIIAPASAAL